MNSIEEWKDIPGFEGVYQISNQGQLKSFKRLNGCRKYPVSDNENFILSNKNRTGDYLSVVLRHGDKIRYCRIHALVAEAFIPNCDNKPEVNHKDCNKQNNCVGNLEWVTRRENHDHAVRNNPSLYKSMNYYNRFIRPRIIRQISLSGEFIGEYPNSHEAAKSTGVCQRNILQVANKTEYKPGKTRRQAGGYMWRFKDAAI